MKINIHIVIYLKLKFSFFLGKVAIVTGGARGIGYEVVKALFVGGCKVYLLCRNLKQGQVAQTEIQRYNILISFIQVFSKIKKPIRINRLTISINLYNQKA